jgi:hypothetical protein
MKKQNSTQDKKLGLSKKASKLLAVKTGLKAGPGTTTGSEPPSVTVTWK